MIVIIKALSLSVVSKMKVYILIVIFEVIFAIPIDENGKENVTKVILGSKDGKNSVEKVYDSDQKQKVNIEKSSQNDIKNETIQEFLGVTEKVTNEKKIILKPENSTSVSKGEANNDDYDDIKIVAYSAFVGDGCATGLAKINGICADIDY